MHREWEGCMKLNIMKIFEVYATVHLKHNVK
jgi:hypothetical protein